MSVLTLRVDTTDTDVFVQTNNGNISALNLAQMFKSMAGGARTKASTLRTDVTPVAASGYLAIDDATVTGTVGGTINGVTVTVASGTDTGYVVAVALAVAFNASSNALIAGIVTAVASNPTGDDGRVTFTAVRSALGASGNAVTLAASGTGVTASGARLTGGTDGTSTIFTF